MYPVISSSQERSIAAWCHYSALFGLIIPYANILGPLIVWLTNKNKSSLIDDQGRESLNFQLTASLGMTVLIAIGFIMHFLFLGGVASLAIFIVNVLIQLLALAGGMRASAGRRWRYPFKLRFIQ